jgi:hypothetical protein
MAFYDLRSSEIKAICDYLSLLQIKFDCETVKSLIPCFQQKGGNTISLGIMPYLSLTAYSALEYLHNHGYSHVTGSDDKSIAEVRLKLKMFENGYGKAKKMILNIDYLQDQIFRSQLKFDITHRWNIHYNLGLYFDVDHRLLYNTQYAYYAMQDNAVIKRSIATVRETYELNPEIFGFSNKTAYEYSFKCSQIIGSVIQALENFDVPITNMVNNCDIAIFYADYNTNLKSTLFPNGEEGKALKLYLLHTLSTINYVLYALSTYEIDDYGWWLKINYITFFYAHRKLRDLRDHLVQNHMLTCDMAELIKSSGTEEMSYINVDFRNYLMHSKLTNKNGDFLIKVDKLDKSKPFFGLIESCFDGISYSELRRIIHNSLSKISDALEIWLEIDKLVIKPLD